MADPSRATLWPEIAYEAWRDTALTLQLWMQIVGMIRLSFAPWLNHSWQVPLYVTARGLGTSAIPADDEVLELEFDFVSHRLTRRTSRGQEAAFSLEPMTVADFYGRIQSLLKDLAVAVVINPLPSELAGAIPFSEDRAHAAYDADAAHRFWRVLIQADRLFKLFRTGFLGKASPTHFFWGGFDLAVTRFSGRRAPLHPGGIPGLSDRVTREAYSHEVSSAGFWPGNDAFPHAAFYSYAYPQPLEFPRANMPTGAAYDPSLGEFILPYDTMRAAPNQDGLVLEFLQAAYGAAADLGNWDRAALECALGRPNKPRAID